MSRNGCRYDIQNIFIFTSPAQKFPVPYFHYTCYIVRSNDCLSFSNLYSNDEAPYCAVFFHFITWYTRRSSLCKRRWQKDLDFEL